MSWPVRDPADGPVIVVQEGGGPPPDGRDADLCLTCQQGLPAPWVSVADPVSARNRVLRACAAQPVAAAVLIRLLRLTEGMAAEAALDVESLAFSTLLGGAEFRAWVAKRGQMALSAVPQDPVQYARTGDAVVLRMHDPTRYNALSSAMRDALVAALDTCLIDPTLPHVTLVGDGRVFCSGGALEEFGTARDLAAAHLIRRGQSVAARLAALGPRARVEVSGPAIGAGAEIAAAAATVWAHPGAWFQLPELGMGLVPGAGGIWSIPRRIGRHRAAWLMLTGQRLSAARALDWGLVDRVVGS